MPAFEKLIAWQHAHRLALAGYELSQKLPTQERYALADQIRRCASSVPTNIAEGYGRDNDREFAYFLRVALGSAAELQSLMLLARDLEYVERGDLADFWPQAAETIRVVEALRQRLNEELACEE